MDQIGQQNDQSVSRNETCGETSSRYSFYFYSWFANFFECDRRFLPMQIVPYEIHVIRNENPLTQPLSRTVGQTSSFDRIPNDSILVDPIEESKCEQLKSWTWWKRFLCCPYPEDEEQDYPTQYELRDPRFIETDNNKEIEDQKFGDRKETKNEDDIIFLDDDMDADEISDFTIEKNNNPAAITQHIKVNPKQKALSIGVKKKSVGSLNKNSTNQDSSNSQLFSPMQKSSIYQNDRKISSDFTLSSLVNVLTYPNEPIKHNSINSPKTEFRANHFDVQLVSDTHIKKQQQEIPLVHVPRSHQNHFQQNTNAYFQKTQPISDNIQNDGLLKRKRRNNNPFNQSIVPHDDFDTINQNPPEDLSKKKRRKRKDIKEDEKNKQQRANKRDKQEMEVIIFSADELD